MSAPALLSVVSPDASGPALLHLPHAIPDSLATTHAHVRQNSTSVHRLHASPSEEERERERAAAGTAQQQQPAEADKERQQSREREVASPPATADAVSPQEPAVVSVLPLPLVPFTLPSLSTSLPHHDERPHTPQPSTPPPLRPSSAAFPPPAVRATTLIPHSSDSYSPDGGLHHSGEKRASVYTSTSSINPPTAPPSRPPSRQLSTSDAPLPVRATSLLQPSSSSSQPPSSSISISEPKRYSVLSPPPDRPLKVTNEALSLRKQSLRHPPTSSSSTPPLPLSQPSETTDLSLLHRHVAFQDAEIASYKRQILALTSESARLAAELRAYPHSAAEVMRLLASLRGEVKGLEGRVGVLMGEKKVWGVKMKNFHAEMSHMEREYIKDRQRLEEALRREEERGERMRVEWEGREEKMQAMARERRREAEELEDMRGEARDMERRWMDVQAEYERMMAAWTEERTVRQEVEGRMKGEAYTTLFHLIKQVGEYERKSREWEREMGRREQLQRGLEELERRYTQAIDAVQERDGHIQQLRHDNTRLVTLLHEESRRGQAWYHQGAGGADAGHSGSAVGVHGVEMRPMPVHSSAQPHPHATPVLIHTASAPYSRRRSGSLNPLSLSSLPFPSLVEGHEVELPRASSATALPVPSPLPSPSSTPLPPLAPPSSRPTSLPSSSSVPNLNTAVSTTKAEADVEEKRLTSLTVPPPASSSSSTASSPPSSVRSTVLSSPSSYLSTLLTSASRSMTPSKATAAAFDFFLTPKGSQHPVSRTDTGLDGAGGEERKQRTGEVREQQLQEHSSAG